MKNLAKVTCLMLAFAALPAYAGAPQPETWILTKPAGSKGVRVRPRRRTRSPRPLPRTGVRTRSGSSRSLPGSKVVPGSPWSLSDLPRVEVMANDT